MLQLALLTLSKREPTFAVTSSTSVNESMFTDGPRKLRSSVDRRRPRPALQELSEAYGVSPESDYWRLKYTRIPLMGQRRFWSDLCADGGLSQQVVFVCGSGAHVHRRAEERRVAPTGILCGFLRLLSGNWTSGFLAD